MEKLFGQICEEYAGNRQFSGACMAATASKVLFSGAYGYASRAFRVPNRIDTRFDTASLTKVFTATAVLLLVERGLLRLEDHICDVIDLTGTNIPPDVTLGHLLTHTSGIADDADEEAGENYADLFADSPNYAIRECEDFLKNFAYKQPHFAAGTDVRYNNCAFILLGLAIERITGMHYRDFVERDIFKACEMTDTRFCAMDEANDNTAEGYYAQRDDAGGLLGWKKNIYRFPPVGTADSGAYTTVGDLHTFLRAIRGGRLLSPFYSEQLLAPHCPFTRPSSWKTVPGAVVRNGYAFEFLEVDGETFCISKDGINDGVATIFSYYPGADITLSILANQDCNIWEMRREMMTALYHRFYER